MSFPPLRQPKKAEKSTKIDPEVKENDIKVTRYPQKAVENVIITLKDEKKLVVPSDSYHGLLNTGQCFECVFCNAVLELDMKEVHKRTPNHVQKVEQHPHMEEFGQNLLRKINKENHYCTVCNVLVTMQHIGKHCHSEAHCDNLTKAITKAQIYQPVQ